MPAYIYHNNQWHLFTGNQIYKGGIAHTMQNTDQIVMDHALYNLGIGGNVPMPSDSEAPEINHYNGDEPTGNKWYFTPDGAGTKDGRSWENARSGSQLNITMLDIAEGDAIYMMEGEYNISQTLYIPGNVNIYGGFTSNAPSWHTRDGFQHQTKLIGNGNIKLLNGTKITTNQKLDGVVITQFTDVYSDNLTIVNSLILNYCRVGYIERCVVKDTYINVQSASDCNIFDSDIRILYGNSVFLKNVKNSSGSSNFLIQRASWCTAINSAISCNSISDYVYIFGDDAKHCKAVNCSCTSSNNFGNSRFFPYPSIYGKNAQDCKAINCNVLSENSDIRNYACIFSFGAHSCISVNCKSLSSDTDIYEQSDTEIFSSDAQSCIAINCSSYVTNETHYSETFIYGENAKSCIAINCSAINSSSTESTYDIGCAIFSEKACFCNAVNCYLSSPAIYPSHIFGSGSKSCCSFNNESDTEYQNYSSLDHNSGCIYNNNLFLLIGTDNSITKFAETGFTPAKGVQNVGDCPNPLIDDQGYNDWIAQFGDWHPMADSYLVGRGLAIEGVTTDLDGVTRPDPPAIGAYEPRPAAV